MVVRLEGLLVEDSSAIPSTDPIPAAVQFVQSLWRGGSGRVLMATTAPEEITDDTILGWLRQYQIPATDLVRLNPHPAVREEDLILSAAGARSTVLGLYVVAHPYDVEYMAAHGVPTVAFVHADPVIDYRPERGLSWAQFGRSEEDDDEDVVRRG
jgi:hypothetical protein